MSSVTRTFRIKKGLDLPIQGEPTPIGEQLEDLSDQIDHVALVGPDLVGMKPTMKIKVGESVKAGQVLFEDKKNPGVIYTSPVSGTVTEINRGERRVFQSVVIKRDKSSSDAATFENYKDAQLTSYHSESLRALLVESGEWSALRVRPFSKVPSPSDYSFNSIFVTAIDTQPLAFDPEVIIQSEFAAFKLGLKVLSLIAGDKPVHLCVRTQTKLFDSDSENLDLAGLNLTDLGKNIEAVSFEGPHPAGNVGTHIHMVDPVSAKKSVWHIGYQDVIAWGKLLETGKIYDKRVVAIAGPRIRNPRVVQTIRGAHVGELLKDEVLDFEPSRIVSGSVFSGRSASGTEAFLGRYHNQVTALGEGNHREFLGWQSPGFDKFSIKNLFLSKLFPNKKFAFSTNINGSHRSIVAIGSYEKVMPLDIEPTFLVRSLLSRNTDLAQSLGCLELDEEDLALLTFVDPCKHELGPVLRENLEIIEKEG